MEAICRLEHPCNNEILLLWYSQASPWTHWALSSEPSQPIFMATNPNPLPGVRPLKSSRCAAVQVCQACKQVLQAGKYLLTSISGLNSVLSSEHLLLCSSLRFPELHPILTREGVSKYGGTSLPSQLPPRCTGPTPISLSSFPYFFCPNLLCGDELAFLEVWGLLPAFSRCPMEVITYANVYLMYLWGRRWSPCLTSLSSSLCLLNTLFKRNLVSKTKRQT